MPRAVLVPPDQHCWIESDAYDRAAFAELRAEAPSLARLVDEGAALVPHWEPLLADLFCLLFKLDPAWRDAADVAPSAALNRVLLGALRDHPLLASLRDETPLDEARAGLATVLMGEELLELVREEALVPRGDLLDLWSLARGEEELRRRAEEAEHLADTDASAATRAEAEKPAARAEAEVRRKAAQVTERLAQMPARAQKALPTAAAGLRSRLAEVDAESDTMGWGSARGGAGDGGEAATKIELGRRLARSPKLRKLGALVGRMRALALALRRESLERPSSEVFDVELSRELAHILPPELLALRHPVLRRDFLRRLHEGRLLAYRLRGVDERGRGPMIVCLDGSASMAGEKELWSKAVALTLLEIARRQRRLFRFIGFSSKDVPLTILDVNPREHHRVDAARALDVAEWFPAGGTDFEAPLDAAVATLAEARYRRGDVVLITDGECRVADDWLAGFRAAKAELDFALFSVLIDVGPSTTETLAALSDRVTSVSRLTDEAARDLFVQLR
jgi:uncharacterized protein with von Willebrand factor type A (vWA) domain